MISRKARVALATADSDRKLWEIAEQHRLVKDGQIDLAGEKISLKLNGINLAGFRFEGADLTGSEFINCIGENVCFNHCRMHSVSIVSERGCQISYENASFKGASIRYGKFGPGTMNLRGVSFAQAELTQTEFQYGKLSHADFSGGKLVDVWLRSADLTSSNFTDCYMERVCLERANLRECDFTGAEFQKMDFWGEPDFEGAKISDGLRYQFGIVKDPLGAIGVALQ